MKDLFITCSCQSEILRVSKDEDFDYIFTVYSFLAEKYSFWERVKILFGGKVKTCELILSEEEFKKLSDYAIKTDSL
jgi:hypothetical protein